MYLVEVRIFLQKKEAVILLRQPLFIFTNVFLHGFLFILNRFFQFIHSIYLFAKDFPRHTTVHPVYSFAEQR